MLELCGDSLHPSSTTFRIRALAILGRFDEAIEQCRKAIARTESPGLRERWQGLLDALLDRRQLLEESDSAARKGS